MHLLCHSLRGLLKSRENHDNKEHKMQVCDTVEERFQARFGLETDRLIGGLIYIAHVSIWLNNPHWPKYYRYKNYIFVANSKRNLQITCSTGSLRTVIKKDEVLNYVVECNNNNNYLNYNNSDTKYYIFCIYLCCTSHI